MRALRIAAPGLAAFAGALVAPVATAVAVSMLASGVAATFGWLWWRRATPLAAGLALGWGGVGALVAGPVLGAGVAAGGLALVALAALLHLRIIARAGAARVAGTGMAALAAVWSALL